jgi:hypothetical protein
MRIKPSASRRNVVLDIETVTLDPTNAKGALSATTGRIVCIGLLLDDGEQITEQSLCGTDEAELLSSFWATIHAGDVFIGHNILEFDLLFIRQRSWILNVRPSRTIDLKKYYTADLFDTMHLWSNWGAQRHTSLNCLGSALGCGNKTGKGSDVAAWWDAGDLAAISAYCQEDVRLTYKIFCRLMFQPLPARFNALSPTRVNPPDGLGDSSSPPSRRGGTGAGSVFKPGQPWLIEFNVEILDQFHRPVHTTCATIGW